MAVLDARIQAYNKQNGGQSFETWVEQMEGYSKPFLVDLHEVFCGSTPPKNWTKSDILINLYHGIVMNNLTPKQRRRVHHKIRHIAAAGRTSRKRRLWPAWAKRRPMRSGKNRNARR